MKITYTLPYAGNAIETRHLDAVLSDIGEDNHDGTMVMARFFETLHAKGILSQDDLGKILDINITEIQP